MTDLFNIVKGILRAIIEIFGVILLILVGLVALAVGIGFLIGRFAGC